MSKWLVIFLFIGLMNGCETVDTTRQAGNPNLSETNIERVKVGMHEDDVFAVMGAPDETIDTGNGGLEWVYRGSEGTWKRPGTFSRKSSDIRAKILVAQIDSKGIVTNVDYEELQESKVRPF